MWCGKCYTSNPEVHFHVRPPGYDQEEGGEKTDPKDVARMEAAWHKNHQAEDAFLVARNGDHALVPFECDLCVFRKLTRRNGPNSKNPQDQLLSALIRRVNLDAFWSRASSTVKGNAARLRKGIALSAMVGLEGPYIHEGPLPGHDHCGYEVAIQMVLHSRQSGVNSADHLQMETIRKLRSAFGNQVRSSPQSTRESLSLGDQRGNYQRLGKDPSGSFWFSRFYSGCYKRMGQVWKPNRALTTELMIALLDDVESRIDGALGMDDLNSWVVFHSYAVVTYVTSLRGVEGLLLDLGGINRYWNRRTDCVTITLLGKVKGEHGDRSHLLPCSEFTNSGIRVKLSLERLRKTKAAQGFIDGPAISGVNGKALYSRDIDDLLNEVLEEIFRTKRELFPPDIGCLVELRKAYQAFRSFRRASATRAMEKGVLGDDIDVVNRWATHESSNGARPGHNMRQHYAQFEQLLQPFLRYTQAM